ncbi:MAG: cyclic nucleotide-gated ion channel [Hyphomicrobiales bacterium]
MADDTARRRAYLVVEPGASQSLPARLFADASVLAVLASIALAIIQTVPEFAPAMHLAIFDAEALFTCWFAIEYLTRLWIAPESPVYARTSALQARLRTALMPMSLLDLACILPWFILTWFPKAGSVAVLLQVLRFFRLGRYSPALAGVGRVLASELRPLAAAGMLGLAVLLLSATAMYLAEGDAQPDKFSSIPAAMYWGVVTLATVGYGDVVPVTPLGKAITSVSILCGLILFALPVGIIATGFLHEIRNRAFIVTYSMVSRVPLFTGLDGSALAELVSMLKSRRIPRNVEIVRAGEAGDCMFFIASGEVEVLLPGNHIRLGPGDFFGEMAILGGVPRSATVVASRASELLVLDAADVVKFTAKHPQLAEPLRAAAERRKSEGTAEPAPAPAPAP